MSANYTATKIAYTVSVDDLDLRFEPVDSDDVTVHRSADNLRTTVRYMVHDGDSSHFDSEWVIGFGNELLLFNNGTERDEWLEANTLGDRQFLLERYEHGLVHYSVIETGNYPDRQWDVAHGVGVLTLADDYVAPEGGTLASAANAVMQTYSDWCNGSIYGIVTDVFDRYGDLLHDECDDVWGYIGYDHAKEEL